MLRQLNTTAVFMQATAHPDDENNALHVYLNRGRGVRTILATATRGDGGQNEIGPELHDSLAVLRTEELEAMHRFDSTEQYFTRAIDFGYSFSIEETLEKWGRDEIIGDYVRLIRTTRPDVMSGDEPDRHRRRASPSDIGPPQSRGLQSGRRSVAISRADPRRAHAVAAAQVSTTRWVARRRWTRPRRGALPVARCLSAR